MLHPSYNVIEGEIHIIALYIPALVIFINFGNIVLNTTILSKYRKAADKNNMHRTWDGETRVNSNLKSCVENYKFKRW